LKKVGIVVCSVTQPTDASTASGSLQQNIQFIFSEYENQQRREKCMAGVKEMLMRGEWCTAPPVLIKRFPFAKTSINTGLLAISTISNVFKMHYSPMGY